MFFSLSGFYKTIIITMDGNKEKDVSNNENIFKEPASPKNNQKREKTKYQAFKSDEDESSDNEETEMTNRYIHIIFYIFLIHNWLLTHYIPII